MKKTAGIHKYITCLAFNAGNIVLVSVSLLLCSMNIRADDTGAARINILRKAVDISMKDNAEPTPELSKFNHDIIDLANKLGSERYRKFTEFFADDESYTRLHNNFIRPSFSFKSLCPRMPLRTRPTSPVVQMSDKESVMLALDILEKKDLSELFKSAKNKRVKKIIRQLIIDTSTLVSYLGGCESTEIKEMMIGNYVETHNIAEVDNMPDYNTFNTFLTRDDNRSPSFTVQQGGDITHPIEKLEVEGDMKISGNTLIAKGITYALTDVLGIGVEVELSGRFSHAHYTIFKPDMSRSQHIFMPFSGQLKAVYLATDDMEARIKKPLIVPEHIVLHFISQQNTPFYMVLSGAVTPGTITMEKLGKFKTLGINKEGNMHSDYPVDMLYHVPETWLGNDRKPISWQQGEKMGQFLRELEIMVVVPYPGEIEN